MQILLEHFLHVGLWSLGVQGQDVGERVLGGAESIICWKRLVSDIWSRLGQLDWLLFHTHISSVPVLGEFVAVVDEALPSIHFDLLTAHQVGRAVVSFIFEAHSGAVGQDWLLCQSLFLKKHWECVLSRILRVDFLDLDFAIGQVVVEDVVFVAAVVRSIFPENVEAEHFSIVVEEAFERLVGATALEHHLDVVLHFCLVGRRLLIVHHCTRVLEQIFWEWLGRIESSSLARIKSSGKFVTVDNSENTLVNIKVLADAQVLPCVVNGFVMWQWQLVSLHEDALWDAGVLHSWLDDVNGVIVEVVVDDALANSEILILVLNDWLLEVSVEFKYLNSNVHISYVLASLNLVVHSTLLNQKKLTYLSCLSHFGAIFGMASFSWSILLGTPSRVPAMPSLIDSTRDGSTFSCKLVVFSVRITC